MKYAALLRGINVGKTRWIKMDSLTKLFEELGCKNVSTYLNSGNVIFESDKKVSEIKIEVEYGIKKNFGFDVPVHIKTKTELEKIAKAIPEGWQNDSEQKTDVAFLFEEIDSKKTIDALPINKEFVDVRYVKGAIFWNVKRADYNKSRLNKIIGHKYYLLMTVRNVNTARFIAGIKE